MSENLVDVEYSGSVGTIRLNRPPENILTIEMMEQINAALLDFRNHPELKVLVLRGAGDIFCAGADPQDLTRDKVTRKMQVFHRIFESMRLLDVIAVSAVQGKALGAGFELAIGCNLVLASEDAVFGLPHVDFGLFPPLASVVLPRAGPRRKAMEWILTADEIEAGELERFGLVNRLLAKDNFDEELDRFVEKLTSKSGPVLQLARRAQVESYYATYEEALYKAENLYLRDLMALDDAYEGIQARIEGRNPTWSDG